MSSKKGSAGMTFLSVLGLIFIILKLTGFIAWSWWLVTLPFWGGIVLAIFLVIIVVAVNAYVSGKRSDRRDSN